MDLFQRDTLLRAYKFAVETLDKAKVEETRTRAELVRFFAPDGLSKGTANFELGGGYLVKVVQPYYYKLDADKIDGALDAIAALGNEGAFLAENRLVKFKPELSVSEYNKLAPQYKTIIDNVLKIPPGTPSVELVAPKGV